MKNKPVGDRLSPRRRDFLEFTILATTLVGLAPRQAAAAAACEADDTGPASASMRKELEYSSPSKTAGKTCSGCAFYAATAPNCGKCQVINGPVSSGAVCSSWAPKESAMIKRGRSSGGHAV